MNLYLIPFCLLYTSDAADERSSVDLGGRRIIKKKTISEKNMKKIILNKTNLQRKDVRIWYYIGHRDAQKHQSHIIERAPT